MEQEVVEIMEDKDGTTSDTEHKKIKLFYRLIGRLIR